MFTPSGLFVCIKYCLGQATTICLCQSQNVKLVSRIAGQPVTRLSRQHFEQAITSVQALNVVVMLASFASLQIVPSA